MRPYYLLFSLLFLLSCGSSKEEKIESAIDLALTYLTYDKCEDALSVLNEEVDLQNAVYLQVLASAHACKAGINVVQIIGEMESLETSKVLYELAKRDFALVRNNDSFNALTTAVNTITSSTTTVSQEERTKAFGPRKGQDLGVQLLIYSVVQVSRYLNYYGNAEAGRKGEGSGVNTCFLDYVNNPILPGLLPTSNNCGINGDGHPELDLATPSGRKNACNGVILINNVLDVFENIEFGDSENLQVLKEISEKISFLRENLTDIDPGLEFLFNIRDHKSCEDLSDSDVEKFIFALFEVGFE